MDISKFEERIGLVFKNKNLLKEALTHRSYLNENHDWNSNHNERLEFLGDAVLELVVTEELFNRYSKKDEGWMTSVRASLVNTVMLASVAKEIGLEEFIFMSKGESRDTGKARDAILANALEALIGSIHLDNGYDRAKKFINSNIVSKLEDVLSNHSYIDSKSSFQEKAQAQLGITPNYRVLEESGPDHKRNFVMGVYFEDKLIASGSGMSKQEAEVEAALKALETLDKK